MTHRFTSKKHIFGKYDIRGIYRDEIDEGTVGLITSILAEKVFKKSKVVLGHDARNSSPSLYRVAKEVLRESNIDVIDAKMITTPMLTFLVNDLGASGGIMITASHNPPEYNGIKAIGHDSLPISGEDIYKLL